MIVILIKEPRVLVDLLVDCESNTSHSFPVYLRCPSNQVKFEKALVGTVWATWCVKLSFVLTCLLVLARCDTVSSHWRKRSDILDRPATCFVCEHLAVHFDLSSSKERQDAHIWFRNIFPLFNFYPWFLPWIIRETFHVVVLILDANLL